MGILESILRITLKRKYCERSSGAAFRRNTENRRMTFDRYYIKRGRGCQNPQGRSDLNRAARDTQKTAESNRGIVENCQNVPFYSLPGKNNALKWP